MGCLIGLILLLVISAISWIVTCGILWLITLCFKLTFSWAIATGIWLILCLISGGFKITINNK